MCSKCIDRNKRGNEFVDIDRRAAFKFGCEESFEGFSD